MKAGSIGAYLSFNGAGSLEGRLRVHIRSRNKHVGLCSGALSFKAKEEASISMDPMITL